MKLQSAVLALWLMSTVASAQTQTQTLAEPPDARAMPTQNTTDPPPGFPYNTGGFGGNADMPAIVSAQVPLRDFLSSRQDQQRAELIERIESLGGRLQQVIDERDRQYAQRFAAQQDAVDSALAAAKEAVNAALASAKEAVTKAENAANDRFDSVNEFRNTLSDQATQFVGKAEADARLKSIEEKVNSVYDRLNAMQAQKEGGAETWGWLVGIAGVLIALGALLFNMNRTRRPEMTRSDA